MMVKEKSSPTKTTATPAKKSSSSWTLRGVSEATKDAVILAAKEKGVPVGQWVDEALSEATRAPLGQQLLTSLHELKTKADPTLVQLKSRTDETVDKWRAGLIEQVGIAAENIHRLQQQLLGKPEQEQEQEQERAPLSLPDNTTKAKKAAAPRARPGAAKTKKKSGTAAAPRAKQP